MATQFSGTLRTALAQAIVTAVGANFTLEVRTSTPPGVGNAASGTLLATLTSGIWGTPTNGVVTFTMTQDSSGDATGTPGYVRFKTSGGTAIIETPAAVGSGEANFAADVSLGGVVSLNSGSFTVGNA